jgi:hypothetical protein
MNYILEVYSDGMFIPITGRAIVEDDNAVTLEFGIDDYFNNPDWMTTNIYKIESQPNRDLRNNITSENGKVDAFLFDAKRDILTHLGQSGFLNL